MGNLGTIFTAILLLGFLSLHRIQAEPFGDKQALLEFLQKMPPSKPLNWNFNTPVCTNWTGVACNRHQTMVIAVKIPGFGFSGSIPPFTLSRLSGLQRLSLGNNEISGPFPFDFTNLRNLTELYLQSNKFSGPLPSDFSVWKDLTILDLSNNEFTGSVPPSISNLTSLKSLDLSNNSLSGKLPEFDLPRLQSLNLSNNQFNGTLPRDLQRFPRSSFSGNNFSFQNPETISPSPTPSLALPPIVNQPQHHKFGKISETAVIGIIFGSSAVMFLVIAVTLMVFYSKKRTDQNNGASSIPPKAKPLKKKKQGAESDEEKKNGKMSFFEGSNLAFDLEDLLRASAEVLGKGTFGTTYKAALEDSTMVVVKRLKEVGVGKREFEQQMEVVGNIRHENVAPLRAYYYSKDEKLMVYDYFNKGSLATMLHGKADNRAPLDWETRLRIVLGAARGLAHIHTQNNGKFIHGNIKPSNIFLNPHNNLGCIADLGLATLVTPLAPPVQYRAPEVHDPKKSTQASDVYSFGVMILELLTGHTPMVHGMHIVRWVNSVVREEWTSEVFDVALLKSPKVEEELVSMLQLGLTCTERVPDRRPKMWEVVRMVESIPSGTHTSSEFATPMPTPGSREHVVDVGSTSSPK